MIPAYEAATDDRQPSTDDKPRSTDNHQPFNLDCLWPPGTRGGAGSLRTCWVWETRVTAGCRCFVQESTRLISLNQLVLGWEKTLHLPLVVAELFYTEPNPLWWFHHLTQLHFIYEAKWNLKQYFIQWLQHFNVTGLLGPIYGHWGQCTCIWMIILNTFIIF